MVIDFGENVMNVLLFVGAIMSMMLVVVIVIIGYAFKEQKEFNKKRKEFDKKWRKTVGGIKSEG